jgi:hypothetical protein
MAQLDRVAWTDWLPWPWRKWRVVIHVEAADEIPERLPRRGAALAGPQTSPTWIAFNCPCGTSHQIMVNLDNSRMPVWDLTSERPLTLRPSIDDVTPSRRCHFFVREGKIEWARSEGIPT